MEKHLKTKFYVLSSSIVDSLELKSSVISVDSWIV
jgi:hypothetical protein